MIDISQWRISIGLWYCHISPTPRCGGSSGSVDYSLIELCSLTVLIMFVMLLLILSGDIEINPGPKTGASDHSSVCDLLKVYSPQLSRAITDVIWNVTEALHANGLITFDVKDQILTAQGVGDYRKAINLVHVLETHLEVAKDPKNYLISICHVLIHQHHQPLIDICNTILQELGQSTVSGDGLCNQTHPSIPSTATASSHDSSHDRQGWFFGIFHQLQALLRSQPAAPTDDVRQNSQPVANSTSFKQYCDIMRDKYKNYQPYISDWPPKLKCGQQYFGRLTLRNIVQNRQWSMLRGNTDNIPEEGNTIEMVDLIKPNENGESLRAVVDGPPGVGKTTLCRILLNMWATKEHIKHLYDLVLYCPLRNNKIAQAREIGDLFVYQCPEVSMVAEWIEREHGKGVLMIFDGWDELNIQLRRFSLPTSIIRRERLHKCSVIVTSRTYATSSLLNVTSHHKHVQVMGFSSDEVKVVIRGTLEVQSLSEKLISDLEIRDDVMSLCYIPLVCSMVIYVYDKLNGHLPMTLTELYENFILQTIRRHIQKSVNYEPEDILGLNENNLPTDVARNFKELCQFAYISLRENTPKMTFSTLELQQHLKWSGFLGLISECGEDGNQFLHLSIQEFLASWWIAKYEKKTHEIFNEQFDNDHFKMCLRFVAGLSHLEPHDKYQKYFSREFDLQCKMRRLFGFDNYLLSNMYQNCNFRIYNNSSPLLFDNHIETKIRDDFSSLLQLLYESQNSKICSTLANSIVNYSMCFHKLELSPFDILCVKYFLSNSNVIWNHLDMESLDTKELQLFNSTFTYNLQQTGCKVLTVNFSKPKMDACKNFFQLPLFQHIQKCDITLTYLPCNPFFFLVDVLKMHRQLKILHFRSFLDDAVSDSFVISESQLTNLLHTSILQELIIDINSRAYSRELTSICNAVAINNSILSFTLRLNVSSEPLQQLLTNNCTIRSLYLKVNNLSLVNQINTINMPLTTLIIKDSDVLFSRGKLTTPFFLHINGLQCLALDRCQLSPHQIFESFLVLQQLEISLDTAESAIELFTILQKNDTLKALRVEIGKADIYGKMGNSLCQMLTLNKTIAYLEFKSNYYSTNLSTSFLSYLTAGLSHNMNLQELRVPIPLSPTNNEQLTCFFNVICTMSNLTELEMNFNLSADNEVEDEIDEEYHVDSDESDLGSSEEEDESDIISEEKDESDIISKEKDESDIISEESDKHDSDGFYYDGLYYDDSSLSSVDIAEVSIDSNTINDVILTSLYYEHALPSLTNMIKLLSSIRMLSVGCDIIKRKLSQGNWIKTVQELYQSVFLHPTLEYFRIDRSVVSHRVLMKHKKKLTATRKQQKLLKPTPIIELSNYVD